MSDPIAQAAEQIQQTDAQQAQGDAGKPLESALTDTSSTSQATTAQQTGNVLVNSAPIVDAPVVEAPAAEPAAPLPRESHLMLLEHKLAAMHAKFKTGERIVIDEFEQILGHIKAVL